MLVVSRGLVGRWLVSARRLRSLDANTGSGVGWGSLMEGPTVNELTPPTVIISAALVVLAAGWIVYLIGLVR